MLQETLTVLMCPPVLGIWTSTKTREHRDNQDALQTHPPHLIDIHFDETHLKIRMDKHLRGA